MSVVDSMRSEIDRFYTERMQDHPFYLRAQSGSLNERHINRFLADLFYVISDTHKNLRLARDASLAQNRVALANFFSTKMREEQGHEEWARTDMKALGNEPAAYEPSLAAQTLMQRSREWILKDPALYLPYLYFAEYYTVIAAPQTTAILQETCRIPKEGMTVITKHAELDKDHVLEWEGEVATLVDLAKYSQPFMDILNQCFDLYSHIMTNVCNEDSEKRYGTEAA